MSMFMNSFREENKGYFTQRIFNLYHKEFSIYTQKNIQIPRILMNE